MAGLFVLFFVYNAFDLPPAYRDLVLAHDAVLVVALVSLHIAIRLDRVPSRWAHGLGAAVTAAIASNILLVQHLSHDPVHTAYFGILILGVGTLFKDLRWAGSLLFALLATWSMVWVNTFDEGYWPAAFGLVSVSAVALASAASREWVADRVEGLLRQDRDRERALRRALEAARAEQRNLDAQVGRRTADLEWANAALRRQVEESQRARRHAESLAEQLRHAQRVEAMGRLAGGVAHDFNNLITAVIGNVELALLDVDPDSPAGESLRDARDSALRSIGLTRQLLTFSRKGDAPATIVDLCDLVTNAERVVRRLIGEQIHLRFQVPGQRVLICADPVQVDQVLINLAVNARDAMPNGGGLTVTLLADDTWATVVVEDTGVGMDAATLAKVFEPYFTTKGDHGGTGLGLATVKGIVDSLGGELDVVSHVGVGTSFTVRLPVAETSRELRTSTEDRPIPRGRGERVLIVDDEDAVRQIAVRMLTRLGYRPLAAASAEEALRTAEEHLGDLDLLFTDVMLPGADGKQLADRMREACPRLRVLFASGYSGDHIAPRGVLRSEVQFLAKPYDARDVGVAVRRALDT